MVATNPVEIRGEVIWIDAYLQPPREGDHVIVYNGVYVWTTHWKKKLSDPLLKCPVTHYCTRITLPYAMRRESLDIDPPSVSEAGRRRDAKNDEPD